MYDPHIPQDELLSFQVVFSNSVGTYIHWLQSNAEGKRVYDAMRATKKNYAHSELTRYLNTAKGLWHHDAIDGDNRVHPALTTIVGAKTDYTYMRNNLLQDPKDAHGTTVWNIRYDRPEGAITRYQKRVRLEQPALTAMEYYTAGDRNYPRGADDRLLFHPATQQPYGLRVEFEPGNISIVPSHIIYEDGPVLYGELRQDNERILARRTELLQHFKDAAVPDAVPGCTRFEVLKR